jgi:hypothetical protein
MKTRHVRRITEGLTETVDGLVQTVIEVNEGVARPQLLQQLVARHDLAGPLDQSRQDLERLLAQPHADALLAQFARSAVDLEHAETHDRRRTVCEH